MKAEKIWAFSVLRDKRKHCFLQSATVAAFLQPTPPAPHTHIYLFWIVLGGFRHFDLIQPIFLPPAVVHPELPGPQLVTRAYYLRNKGNRWSTHEPIYCICSSESSPSVMSLWSPCPPKFSKWPSIYILHSPTASSSRQKGLRGKGLSKQPYALAQYGQLQRQTWRMAIVV